jgi:hypothetical protein
VPQAKDPVQIKEFPLSQEDCKHHEYDPYYFTIDTPTFLCFVFHSDVAVTDMRWHFVGALMTSDGFRRAVLDSSFCTIEGTIPGPVMVPVYSIGTFGYIRVYMWGYL